MIKIAQYIKTKAANSPADSNTISVPANKTILVKTVQITCPAGQPAFCEFQVGPRRIVAQSDQCYHMPNEGIAIDGPISASFELHNENNPSAALLGVTVFYEEL